MQILKTLEEVIFIAKDPEMFIKFVFKNRPMLYCYSITHLSNQHRVLTEKLAILWVHTQ